MLPPTQARQPFVAEDAATETEFADFGRLLAAGRRQARLAAIAVIAGIVLAGIYLFLATPQFTAETQLLINEDKGKAYDTNPSKNDQPTSDETILSQVELVQSTRIALEVVDKLDLTHDKVFMTPERTVMGYFTQPLRAALALIGLGRSGPDEANLRRQAAERLQDKVAADRIGRTYAISVTYTAADPQFASRVVNAFADAYLNDGLESNFDSIQRTSIWLQQRLAELQEGSREADLAVQKYRSDHGLIAADGKLVSEQQLAELNSQLVLAQADTARARARYEQFNALLTNGAPSALLNAAVATGATDDSAIGKLRIKYLEASTRLNEITQRWGQDHPEAVSIKKEVGEDQTLLLAELERISKSYQNDFAVAQSREQSLRTGLDQMLGTNASNNQVQVELRALQQKADTYRDLYQNFLQRHQQAMQEKSFPVQAARIISEADVPSRPSAPKKPLILAIGALLGLAIGAGVGAVREFRDRFFRTGEQVRTELSMEYLGMVPHIDTRRNKTAGTAEEQGASDHLHRARAAMGYVVENPLSAMAETLRRAKIAADVTLMNAEPKIIGVVSVLPREGKSTISANLARLIAGQGARTLLIDADLRGLGLTQVMASNSKAGLLEVLLEGQTLQDVARVDPETNLVFLPSVKRGDVSHTADMLGSQAMQSFLSETGNMFNYIIVDLPPMAPVADARAFARHVDAVVMVVEWGRTARNMVRSTLAAEPELAAKMLGVVLNNVDMEKMKLYSEFGSNEYYYDRYSTYYTHK